MSWWKLESGNIVGRHVCELLWRVGRKEVWGGVPVEPVKGHMANVRCEPDRLRCVVRTAGVYLVPRGDGRVTVGATLEHVGFDEAVHEAQVRG